LGLARGLLDAGVTILGTSPHAIDLAEDRGQFGQVLQENELNAPKFGLASSYEQAVEVAADISYPVLVRPSFVLGGRGMEIVYDDESLKGFIEKATEITPNQPVLIDRFLDDAIEIDVDALFDGTSLYLAGTMEHIEEAGIHSGDSACVLPSISLTMKQLSEIREATEKIARGVDVRGLINIQFAISRSDGVLYVLEANPRASRTVPFVSKATGIPLAKAAALISIGRSIEELRESGLLPAAGDGIAFGVCVKEAVLPWNRFRRIDGSGVDSILGPEMRSTGEVMGIAETFGEAYSKSQTASFGTLPKSGRVFLSLSERDKAASVEPAGELVKLGFTLFTTVGTAKFLNTHGVASTIVRKNSEPGDGLSAVDIINSGAVDLVINTPLGRGTRQDGWLIRTAAVQRGIPIITTIAGFKAAVSGIIELSQRDVSVRSLQRWQNLVGR
jgi:carbamoyl-phosphate synthase large subunit